MTKNLLPPKKNSSQKDQNDFEEVVVVEEYDEKLIMRPTPSASLASQSNRYTMNWSQRKSSNTFSYVSQTVASEYCDKNEQKDQSDRVNNDNAGAQMREENIDEDEINEVVENDV